MKMTTSMIYSKSILKFQSSNYVSMYLVCFFLIQLFSANINLVHAQKHSVSNKTQLSGEAPKLAKDGWGFEIYDSNGKWEEIGPTTSAPFNINGVGRLSCMHIDQENDSLILVGSPTGGLYYSENFGETWHNGGLDRPIDYGIRMLTPGIASIVISHKNDKTYWIIATGDKDDDFSPCKGILRTTDKGKTWEDISGDIPFGNNWNNNKTRKLLAHPENSDIIFAATSRGIYKTTNALVENPDKVKWEKLLDDDDSYKTGFFDIEFQQGNPDNLFASREYLDYIWKEMNSNELVMSTDGGESWNSMPGIDSILPDKATQKMRILIETTPANKNLLWVKVSVRPETKKDQFYTFNIESQTWSHLSQSYGASACSRNGFAISPLDENIIYYGYVSSYKSLSGGKKWQTDNHFPKKRRHPHSDVHDMKFSSDGNTIWAATDGGIFRKTGHDHKLWEDKTAGIGIAMVHYFDNSRLNPDLYLFGGYDVHSQLFNRETQIWTDKGKGDGYGCAFDNSETGTYYVSNSYSLYRFKENQNVMGKSFKPPFWDRHVVINPQKHNVLFVSNGDKILRSKDQGETWASITSQLGYSMDDYIFYDMHVAEGDSNYLYIRAQAGKNSEHPLILKSTNVCIEDPDSVVWQDITPVNIPNRWIGHIEVDYENPDRIWIVLVSFEKQKIFEYHNSIWTDITGNLVKHSMALNGLAHLHGTNDGIFAAGSKGVFFRPDKQSDWLLYKPGLPNTDTRAGIRINYCSGKIVAGTYGRGLWETDLPENLKSVPVIGKNDHWKGYRIIMQNLTIPTGSTLTISGLVEFAEDNKIIIEPNARLIVDGGTLKNMACYENWGGIELVEKKSFWNWLIKTKPHLEIINGGNIIGGSIITH